MNIYISGESVKYFYKFAVHLNNGYACSNSKSFKGFCKMFQWTL